MLPLRGGYDAGDSDDLRRKGGDQSQDSCIAAAAETVIRRRRTGRSGCCAFESQARQKPFAPVQAKARLRLTTRLSSVALQCEGLPLRRS